MVASSCLKAVPIPVALALFNAKTGEQYTLHSDSLFVNDVTLIQHRYSQIQDLQAQRNYGVTTQLAVQSYL
jgi:hypothetical protein